MKLLIILACITLCILLSFIVMDSLIIAKSSEYRDKIKQKSTGFDKVKMDKFITMNNVMFGMSISYLILTFLRTCFSMIVIIINEGENNKSDGMSITDLFNLAFIGFLIYFILEFGSGIDKMYYNSIIAFLSTIAFFIIVLVVSLILLAVVKIKKYKGYETI